jgi:L-asparaginase / beta-aspartyl-peptidase
MEDKPKTRWALIVHGGAKEMKPEEEEDNRKGVLQALDAGREILARGGAAVDALEACVRVLEDLPVFNAGVGSALTERGEIEMSAAVMDGKDRSVGAIAFVGTLRHPVSVAKALLPEKWVLLVGEGATLFARQQGAEFCEMEELVTEESRRGLKAPRDTVGAVAMDEGGNLAVATGTGGLAGAAVGRVSDTAMPACGYYADNHIGAVAFSGDGESIARVACAAQVMVKINEDGPELAIEKALEQLPGVGGAEGDGGGIGIAKDGRIGWAHNSSHFAVAYQTSEMDAPVACLKKDEERGG